MNAIYYDGNKVIRSGESEPVQPRNGEVQIRVAFAGICGTDLHVYHGNMDKRVTFPHIMGHEMSGIVETVGEGVDHVSVGDHVTVMPLDPCGECPACKRGHSHICNRLKFMGIETSGAYQKFWTVPAFTVLPMPKELSLEYGALIEPLAVACHDVRMGEVAEGEEVVVLGGGPIGALIAMVARAAGAKVLISEINPYRLKLLGDLGFNTINPLEEDIVKYVNERTEDAGCDIVFEVTSSKAGAALMTQLPRTRGRIVAVGIFSQPPEVDMHRFFWRELQMRGARVYEKEDFEKAITLAASGELPLDAIITDKLPLAQLEEGFKKMESGGDAMKILLNCKA